MLSNEQIESKFNRITVELSGIKLQIRRIVDDLNNKIDANDLNRNITTLKALIDTQSSLISDVENRLSKVVLPEETRYYLKEGEVASFQSNLNTMKAMLANMDKMYKNIVAFQSNLINSNSF